MKKVTGILLSTVLLLMANNLFAQRVKVEEPNYRRNSLCMILMDEQKMPNREVILDAFLSARTPAKYNDHNVAVRTFDPASVQITPADENAFTAAQKGGEAAVAEDGKAKKKGAFGGFVKNLAKSAVGGSTIIDTAGKQIYAIKANKYLLEAKIAKQLGDIWFIDSDGNFSQNLMVTRGYEGASAFEAGLAANSFRGESLLKDAGKDLVKNTFVVVSRYRYMSKEELVAEIDAMAQASAALIDNQAVALAAKAATTTLKASLGAGYYVRTTSYLFQFNWNENIQNELYSMWDDQDAYANSDLFSLNYIGQESAFANVKAGIFTNKDEAELIRMATLNATDAVLAKLEKKYDVFKTKTPILEINEAGGYVTALIGTKEGVSAGDKYEVLEAHLNLETSETTYKRVCVLKAAKGKVLKNSVDELAMEQTSDSDVYATHFEGNVKGLHNGMFLRQVK